MVLALGPSVPGLEKALGAFTSGSRPLEGSRGQVPVFDQVLNPAEFYVAFESGSAASEVLTNDQNRFSLPRSLPPILALATPEDEDNDSGAYVITRYAYSEGAYELLEDLLGRGLVFDMRDFLEFGWSLAQALAFLHRHEIVHGQWNPRSVVAIPADGGGSKRRGQPAHRYEILGTGVCFREPESIPRDYIERGYYPPEVFLTATGAPDYGAIDRKGDVYCFCAFLKDVLQRAGSAEELPNQAARILESLQKEANRRGWKASPERLRQKELEILDNLHTIKTQTESLIQEGLRERELRASADRLLDLAEHLHEKTQSYFTQLYDRGFEPLSVFGGELQHYTAFQLTLEPDRINNFEDTRIILKGGGLPDDLVRVTLNERDRGVHVLETGPGRIEFQVSRGFPAGIFKVSINNRRTNGVLEVYAPKWTGLEPSQAHLPWQGFGNLVLALRGESLPQDARYSLRTPSDEDGDEIAALSAREVPSTAPEEAEAPETTLRLEFSAETEPAVYELLANGLETGLRVAVRPRLPDPVILEGALEFDEIKNHREWSLRVFGESLHPDMVLDLGDEAPSGSHCTVESSTEALLHIPAGFPPGEYRLRLNHAETPVKLTVVAPSWREVRPGSLKFRRNQKAPAELVVSGSALPPLTPDGDRYTLLSRRGKPIPDAIVGMEEVRPEEAHLLRLSPSLPRGTPRLRFGKRDTGLEVRVRRALPRSVWATVSVLVLAALIGVGSALHSYYLPRLASLAPDTVYDHGKVAVEAEGRFVSELEVLDTEGAVVTVLPLQPVADSPGTYRAQVEKLRPGSYELRPRGRFLTGSIAEPRLTVHSPAFRVDSSEIHRMEEGVIRIRAGDGYPLADWEELQLTALDAPERTLFLPLIAAGVAEVPRDTFDRETEGRYALAADGVPLLAYSEETEERAPLTVQVVGPVIRVLSPNPVTQDGQGRAHLDVDGERVPQDLWLGLTAESAEEAVWLRPDGEGHYSGAAPPGEYALVFGRDRQIVEAIPEHTLVIYPPASISAISPTKLDPGRPTPITFSGVNFSKLATIVLRPAADDRDPVAIPVDSEQVIVREDLSSTYRIEDLALESGIYLVEPASTSLSLEVFDDCLKLVEVFERDGGDPGALIQCLGNERPSGEVLLRAAGLLFDRGHYEAAREIYELQDDLVSRFRVSLIDRTIAGVTGSRLELREEDIGSAYASAAILLGWASGDVAPLPVDQPLPWELEYARGATASAPDVAIDSLLRAAEQKTRAAGGHEVMEYPPIRVQLARAYLALAEQEIQELRVERARAILDEKLLQDPDALASLSPEEQSRLDFWDGHLSLWYDGAESDAIAAFRRGAQGAGEAARHCRLYLGAVGEEAGDDEPVLEGGWFDQFVGVYAYYREISLDPNFDLLTEQYDFSVYLPAEDRQKSVDYHRRLNALEENPSPRDPLAHYAVLHYLRSAQLVSWPAQDGGQKALEHRARLEALAVSERIQPVRSFYVALGRFGPLDPAQIAVLPASTRREHVDAIGSLDKAALPGSLRTDTESLLRKFNLSSAAPGRPE